MAKPKLAEMTNVGLITAFERAIKQASSVGLRPMIMGIKEQEEKRVNQLRTEIKRRLKLASTPAEIAQQEADLRDFPFGGS